VVKGKHEWCFLPIQGAQVIQEHLMPSMWKVF